MGMLVLHSAQAKVAELDITIGIDEYIGGLDISMDEITFMQIGHCL